jgi:hypothetical protein
MASVPSRGGHIFRPYRDLLPRVVVELCERFTLSASPNRRRNHFNAVFVPLPNYSGTDDLLTP